MYQISRGVCECCSIHTNSLGILIIINAHAGPNNEFCVSTHLGLYYNTCIYMYINLYTVLLVIIPVSLTLKAGVIVTLFCSHTDLIQFLSKKYNSWSLPLGKVHVYNTCDDQVP